MKSQWGLRPRRAILRMQAVRRWLTCQPWSWLQTWIQFRPPVDLDTFLYGLDPATSTRHQGGLGGVTSACVSCNRSTTLVPAVDPEVAWKPTPALHGQSESPERQACQILSDCRFWNGPITRFQLLQAFLSS